MAAIVQSWRETKSGQVEGQPLWRSKEQPAPNYPAAKAQWDKTKASLRRLGVRDEYHVAIQKWVDNGHM